MRIFSIFIFLSFIACNKKAELKQGDIIFQTASKSPLSIAINEVTQVSDSVFFTHMGIVDTDLEGNLFLLHSDSNGGSQKESLLQFKKRAAGNNTELYLYRLKAPYQKAIPKAIESANKMLGKPYNFTYILSDSSFYCSDFVYRAFITDSIFKLSPMSFKNPETEQYSLAWIEHYKQLNISIPEGKLGCNPNNMSTSNKLEFIKKL